MELIDGYVNFMNDMKTWQQIIRRILKVHSITHQDFAQRVGVAPETLSRWLSTEGARPRSENIQRIGEVLREIAPSDFDIKTFLNNVYDFEQSVDKDLFPVAEEISVDPGEFYYVKKIKAILSGGPGSWVTDDKVIGYYAFRKDWIKTKGTPGQMVIMEVAGNSMLPTIANGDHVLIDTSQTDPLHDRIMAISLDDMIVIKRLLVEIGSYRFVSDNPDQVRYATIQIPKDELEVAKVHLIGRVIWRGGEL